MRPAAAARFALARTRLGSHVDSGLERDKEAQVMLSLLLTNIVRAVVAAGRVAKIVISQGCHPRRVICLFIYFLI